MNRYERYMPYLVAVALVFMGLWKAVEWVVK
jgi:hypothetical protein